jgi:hypothetical protein
MIWFPIFAALALFFLEKFLPYRRVLSEENFIQKKLALQVSLQIWWILLAGLDVILLMVLTTGPTG